MPVPVSVCLIVKNCAAPLEECLTSLKPFLRDGDEIVIVDTGSTDDHATRDVALGHGARFLEHPELNQPGMLDLIKQYTPEYLDQCSKDPQFSDGFLADFAAARQLSTDAAKHEIIFWLDSDDVLIGGDALRTLTDEYFQKPDQNALFLLYNYSFDTDGSCNTCLWRERILRKALYTWKGRCHESMCPNDHVPQLVRKIQDPTIRIDHKNGRHHVLSDIRNYAIMTRDYADAEWKDPRTEFYLGNATRGLSRWGESVQWYSKVLERSGSRDDRLSSALNIGAIYMMQKRPWEAIDWFMQAIKIHPDEPRAYFLISRAFYELGQPAHAINWSQFGRAFPTPDHVTSVDPQGFDFYPAIFESLAFRQVGRPNDALAAAGHCAALRPGFPPAQELIQDTQRWAHQEAVKRQVFATAQLASSPAESIKLIQCLQPEFRQQFREFQVESECTAPDHSVTFFCGKTHEPWDASSLADGIGGSEKMVILLARSLAKRGWKVDVYGNPKDENLYKVVDGVAYRPQEAFNIQLPRDVLVLWRAPSLLDAAFKARTIFVDMHDVPQAAEFTPARMEKCAGVFWKSKFHREGAPTCPEEKCIYSRNAIEVPVFQNRTEARDFKKVVWCSSGDRGLLGALCAWERAAPKLEGAVLHVCYGFTPLYHKRAADHGYQFFGDCGAERHMLDYAAECMRAMDRLGPLVRNHGRIPSADLAAHLATAGVWLYPTTFPEISCISAMEAQAAGAFPVCSDTGALKETVTFGTMVPATDQAKIAQALHAVITRGPELDSYRAQMQLAAWGAFNLETLTDQWEQEFTREPRESDRSL